MDPNELQKLMDCCRPDQNDLAEPEMAALRETLDGDAEARAQWQRVCQWDEAVRAAMQDVAVPKGLAERLLDSVKRQERGWNEEVRGAQDTADSSAEVELLRQGHKPARRAAAILVGLCAVAATVALAVWFGPWQGQLTGREVAGMARGWMNSLDRESWRANAAPLAEYPLDPSLRFASIRWQRFEALGDRHAVAYQATLPPDRAAAYLLVIQTHRDSRLPTTPPMVPQSTTEGLCIGTWQGRGLLYVLVVPGSQLQYRRAIDSQSFVMHAPYPPAAQRCV